MSEDTLDAGNPDPQESPQVTNLSPAETKAMESGWVPKEEFEANLANEGKKWRDADEFNDRGELFAKIDELGRKSKAAQKALDQLSAHHAKVREVEYQRALTNLKAAKKAALEDGDADKLIEIDERIADVKQSQRQDVAVQAQGTPPEFEDFVARNKWYTKDVDMTEEADAIGVSYARRNPGIDPQKVFDYVEKRIKTLYPEKFTNPNKPVARIVDTSSAVSRPSTRGFVLDEQEERVARNFAKAGIMTREEYIKELKAVKGVK